MNAQFAALAVGVLLISAPAATAPSGDRTEPCATAYRFDPNAPAHSRDRQQPGAQSQMLETGQPNDFIASSCRSTPRGRQEVLQGSRPDTAIGMSFLVAAVP